MQPSNDDNDNHPNSALIDRFTKNILLEKNSSYWEYTYRIPFFNKIDGIKNVRAYIELSKELIKPDFTTNFYHVNVYLKIKKYNPHLNMMFLPPGEDDDSRLLLSEIICTVQFDDAFENLPPRLITDHLLRNNTIGGLYNNMMIILNTASTLLSNLKFDKYEVLFYSKLINFPNEKRFWCKEDIHVCCVCDDDCGSYIASCNHYICLVCASSLVRETCPLCRTPINKILIE